MNRQRTHRWWSIAEVRIMRALIDLCDDDEFACWFRSTRSGVRAARLKHGIIRTSQRYRGKDGIRKSMSTEFVKGHRPTNAHEAGKVYVRKEHGKPVVMVSVERGRPIRYALHVWTEAHGPVPKGMIVVHRDGDPLNCEPGNLEAISRGEHARRNAAKADRSARARKIWAARKRRAAYASAKAVYVDPFIKRAA